MKVVVFGASGLTGATLVERLAARGIDVVACIHSSGNAWRLARLSIPLTQVDMNDAGAVEAVVRGCTHIVNCARGDDATMIGGLKNLIAASRAAHVRQLVHLSSVMVYGDPPIEASHDEDAPTSPVENTYGWVKLKQDEMVEAAAGSGLPATVLCPPNISGPYSHYLQGVVGAIERGRLAIVDGGHAPCVLVDVANLCHAIELALERGANDGKRLFVTDGACMSWNALVAELSPLVRREANDRLPTMTSHELEPLLIERPKPRSIGRSLKHIVSSEVRAAMRLDPIWQDVDSRIRRGVARLGGAMEDKLRLSIEGSVAVAKASPHAGIDLKLSGHQLRKPIHSIARIERVLGYRPVVSPQESMAAFRAWYAKHHGFDDAFADLVRQLAA